MMASHEGCAQPGNAFMLLLGLQPDSVELPLIHEGSTAVRCLLYIMLIIYLQMMMLYVDVSMLTNDFVWLVQGRFSMCR